MMKKVYYIYSLINPLDNKIFYVGQTVNPTKRFKDHMGHLKESARENKEKVKIINAILKNGNKPVFKVLQCVWGLKSDAEKAETEHIINLKNNGVEIVNLTTIYNRSSDNGKKIAISAHKDDCVTMFMGIRECAAKLNIHHSNISAVLSGKRKTTQGYNFNYIK
jgi:hypothetical protein